MVRSEDAPLVLGIDLGGTKVLAAVVDRHNTILGRAKVATPARQGERAILDAIRTAAMEAIQEAGADLDAIAGVCLGSPGPLDPERGLIHYSANLNVKNFAIGPELARVLGRPVMVQNDVRVGGVGEFRLGSGRGHRNVLAAFVGTGIGGCLVLDGRVITGATGNAGEIGHIVLKPRGPRCGCGRRGCMEALASRSAIARRIAKAHRKGVATVLGEKATAKGQRLKSKELASAFLAKDAVTVREVSRAARFLGLGLGGLINVVGPEVIIVGGGVTKALGESYLNLVRAAAQEQMLTAPKQTTPIVAAALGDDAGILGAALLARERFANDPAPADLKDS